MGFCTSHEQLRETWLKNRYKERHAMRKKESKGKSKRELRVDHHKNEGRSNPKHGKPPPETNMDQHLTVETTSKQRSRHLQDQNNGHHSHYISHGHLNQQEFPPSLSREDGSEVEPMYLDTQDIISRRSFSGMPEPSYSLPLTSTPSEQGHSPDRRVGPGGGDFPSVISLGTRASMGDYPDVIFQSISKQRHDSSLTYTNAQPFDPIIPPNESASPLNISRVSFHQLPLHLEAGQLSYRSFDSPIHRQEAIRFSYSPIARNPWGASSPVRNHSVANLTPIAIPLCNQMMQGMTSSSPTVRREGYVNSLHGNSLFKTPLLSSYFPPHTPSNESTSLYSQEHYSSALETPLFNIKQVPESRDQWQYDHYGYRFLPDAGVSNRLQQKDLHNWTNELCCTRCFACGLCLLHTSLCEVGDNATHLNKLYPDQRIEQKRMSGAILCRLVAGPTAMMRRLVLNSGTEEVLDELFKSTLRANKRALLPGEASYVFIENKPRKKGKNKHKYQTELEQSPYPHWVLPVLFEEGMMQPHYAVLEPSHSLQLDELIQLTMGEQLLLSTSLQHLIARGIALAYQFALVNGALLQGMPLVSQSEESHQAELLSYSPCLSDVALVPCAAPDFPCQMHSAFSEASRPVTHAYFQEPIQHNFASSSVTSLTALVTLKTDESAVNIESCSSDPQLTSTHLKLASYPILSTVQKWTEFLMKAQGSNPAIPFTYADIKLKPTVMATLRIRASPSQHQHPIDYALRDVDVQLDIAQVREVCRWFRPVLTSPRNKPLDDLSPSPLPWKDPTFRTHGHLHLSSFFTHPILLTALWSKEASRRFIHSSFRRSEIQSISDQELEQFSLLVKRYTVSDTGERAS